MREPVESAVRRGADRDGWRRPSVAGTRRAVLHDAGGDQLIRCDAYTRMFIEGLNSDLG